MARQARRVIEYRSYDLPAQFPLLMLDGEEWHISDVPSPTLHFHNALEIGLCESDSGVLDFFNAQLRFQAGDVTVISGDVAHTTWSDPGLTSRWRYIFVDAEELLRPFFPLDILPDASLFREVLSGFYAVLSHEKHHEISALVKSLFDELTLKRLNYEVSARGLFLALMTHFMRIRAKSGIKKAQGGLAIAPALEFINTHYMDNFSIGDLADRCGMSQSHFRRVFHNLMGVSPLEQVNLTRISKACSMLRMTDRSILTVSEQVGFRSLSSFNRHFLATAGVSPTEWRRTAGTSRRTSVLKYDGWLIPPHD